jgi:hypothetical protein
VKPRRTHNSTHVFRLEGGTEDNDLWAYYAPDEEGLAVMATVWVPTQEERERIFTGENVRLLLWARQPYPMAMDITDEPLGKRPEEDESSDLRST